MNRIVTADDFCLYSSNRELNADELERVLDVAQQTIDANVCGRLSEFDNFPQTVKDNVVKAICAQADHIVANFGTDLSEVMPESATLGSFSYSLGSSGGSDASGSSPASLDPVALTYLRTTGLLYRGVGCEV